MTHHTRLTMVVKRKAFHAWLAVRPWQRHSIVLLMGGLVYLNQGQVYLRVRLTDDRAAGLAAALHLTGGSAKPWGALWVVVGLMALVSTVWPPQSKTWGYTALAAMSAFWGSVYGLSTLLLGAPPNNYTGLGVWWLVAVLWWGVSGLVNPDDLPLNEPPGE